MKRPVILFLLIAILILALAIFFIFRLENGNSTAPEPSAAPVVTPTPVPTATPRPEVTASPTPILITASPSPTPILITPDPTETPAVTPEPTVGPASQTGVLRSESGAKLNIIVEWSLRPNGDKYDLVMDVFAESYALTNSQRSGDIVFRAGDQTVYGSSCDVYLTENTLTKTYLGSGTVPVSPGQSVAVQVDWYFNGTYSGQSIGAITAQGTVQIPG